MEFAIIGRGLSELIAVALGVASAVSTSTGAFGREFPHLSEEKKGDIA